jgi:hypothetical protein
MITMHSHHVYECMCECYGSAYSMWWVCTGSSQLCSSCDRKELCCLWGFDCEKVIKPGAKRVEFL